MPWLFYILSLTCFNSYKKQFSYTVISFGFINIFTLFVALCFFVSSHNFLSGFSFSSACGISYDISFRGHLLVMNLSENVFISGLL